MKKLKIILLGTQTLIAETILGQLEAHHYPFEQILLMDHPEQTQKSLFYMGEEKPILPIDLFSEKSPFIALVCDKKIPRTYPKKKIPKHSKVIDCTGLISKAPCFIPGINSFSPKTRLICAPTSLSVILAHALIPLKTKAHHFQITALIGTSFLGKESAQKLRAQNLNLFIKENLDLTFSSPTLAFNLIPEIISPDKLVTPHQLKCLTNISIEFSHCFVPVFRGFSLFIRCTLNKNLELHHLWQNSELISLLQETSQDFLMSSCATLSETKVYVHHLKLFHHQLSFWLTGDDLQSGMALNVIRIIQALEKII